MIDHRHDPVRGGVRPPSASVGADHPQGAGRVERGPGGSVWARVVAVAAGLLLAGPVAAQPRGGKAAPPKPAPADKVEPTEAATPPPAAAGKGKPKVFDFTGLDLAGRLRTPQLLYFLDRASEELERASLERRSFIPAMIRSIDESDL